MPLTARALLLDMDGTLVNSDAVVERYWRIWATEQGLDPADVLRVVHGRQAHATMAALLPDRPVERNLADNEWMLERETADLDGVVPIPGAPAFMTALAGLPHALVTSADDGLARARMGAAGLPLPAVLVTAERVGREQAGPGGLSEGRRRAGLRAARTAWSSRTRRSASRRAGRPGCAWSASAREPRATRRTPTYAIWRSCGSRRCPATAACGCTSRTERPRTPRGCPHSPAGPATPGTLPQLPPGGAP